MANEIIKERMLRELVLNTSKTFWTLYPHQAFRDLFITDNVNMNTCIHEEYIGDNIDDSVHAKINALYKSIVHMFENNVDFETYIQIDFDSDTIVTIIFENHIVHKTIMKSWRWTWNSIEELQDFMLDVIFDIISNTEALPTKEELEMIYDIRKSTDFTRKIVELDGKYFLQYFEV